MNDWKEAMQLNFCILQKNKAMKLSNVLLAVLAGSAVVVLARQLRQRHDDDTDDVEGNDFFDDGDSVPSSYHHPLMPLNEDGDHPLFV